MSNQVGDAENRMRTKCARIAADIARFDRAKPIESAAAISNSLYDTFLEFGVYQFGDAFRAFMASRSKKSKGRAAETQHHMVVYEDGSTVELSSWAGGAAPGGEWSTLALLFIDANGVATIRKYELVGTEPALVSDGPKDPPVTYEAPFHSYTLPPGLSEPEKG